MAKQRSPVQADVARLAGVSNQTISRVVTGTGYVAPATRERVLAAMRELDYRPNSAARALVTGRSHTIGVVARDSADYGPTMLMLGLEREARALGYRSITARVARVEPEFVYAAIDELQQHNVEGIVLHTGLRDSSPEIVDLGLTIPAVAIENVPAVQSVGADQAAGAAAATRLLVQLGHRVIAHVAGPQETRMARERLQGWRATLEAAGLVVPPPLVGDWSLRAGYEAGVRLAADESVTAVFAASDAMALGVMSALHAAGRNVPRDVSVVGFDDVPEARYLTPPLTTVRQDFEAMGRTMMRLLLDAINGLPVTSSGVAFTPELIVRGSTAAAPSRLTEQAQR